MALIRVMERMESSVINLNINLEL